MNKSTLSTFGNFPELFKDALCTDIKDIEKFLKKKNKIVEPYDDTRYLWELDDEEVKHLRVLCRELKDVLELHSKHAISPKGLNGTHAVFTFYNLVGIKIIKSKGLKRLDSNLYRDLIRQFAPNTLEVLVKNKFQVECAVKPEDSDNIIIEAL